MYCSTSAVFMLAWSGGGFIKTHTGELRAYMYDFVCSLLRLITKEWNGCVEIKIGYLWTRYACFLLLMIYTTLYKQGSFFSRSNSRLAELNRYNTGLVIKWFDPIPGHDVHFSAMISLIVIHLSTLIQNKACEKSKSVTCGDIGNYWSDFSNIVKVAWLPRYKL